MNLPKNIYNEMFNSVENLWVLHVHCPLSGPLSQLSGTLGYKATIRENLHMAYNNSPLPEQGHRHAAM